MAQPQVNDFDAWQDNTVPVILANADADFNVWYQNVPLVDRDVAQAASTTSRRRSFEF